MDNKIAVKTLDCFELKKKMESGEEVCMVDVRSAWEREECTFPNDTHIPIVKLESSLEALDKSKAYVVYCHHGVRSKQGAEILARNGFKQVFHLKGGIHEWAKKIDSDVSTY